MKLSLTSMRPIVVLAALATLTSVAWAAPVMVVLEGTPGTGEYTLLPNTRGQKISIFVTGGDPIDAIDMFLQVGDGGPERGGSIIGPSIESIDVVTDTIFAHNYWLPQTSEVDNAKQLWYWGVLTDEGTVNAEGLLATVTIDTTGFYTPGLSWDFKLTATTTVDSVFRRNDTTIPATFTNGRITIAGAGPSVPEPSMLALVGTGGLGLLWLVRRRSVA